MPSVLAAFAISHCEHVYRTHKVKGRRKLPWPQIEMFMSDGTVLLASLQFTSESEKTGDVESLVLTSEL